LRVVIKRRQQALVDLEHVSGEATEYDFLEGSAVRRAADGLNGDAGGGFGGVSKYASTDGGERYAGRAARLRQFKGAAVAGREQVRLVVIAAAPDWTDGVDDDFGGQAKGGRNFGVAGLAPAELATRRHHFRTRRPQYRARHAARADERWVGGVDDRVNIKAGDVRSYGAQVCFHIDNCNG